MSVFLLANLFFLQERKCGIGALRGRSRRLTCGQFL